MPNRSGKVAGIRLMLLRDYLEANAGKDRAVKRRAIQDYLKDKGYWVEQKTLYTDLDILRTECNMLIEYNQHKKGYVLLNPPFEPYELRLMVDSVQSSKFITKTVAKDITGKIKRMAGKEARETLNRQSYVADRVRSMNDSVVKDADRIHEAIATNRKISFRYFHYTPDKSKEKNYSKDGAQYIVSPYVLSWNDGNYYLRAYDGKKFRNFRVDRMERISIPLLEEREGQEQFEEEQAKPQQAKVFNMYGGPEYNVRMRFRNELADAVIDQFGKDIVMIPQDNEHFTITTAVQISPTFFAWISTFGRRAKILGPEPVVEKMKKFVIAVSDMYKDEGEK